MELDYKAIGKRIKIARIRAEISQEQLSALVDLSPSHMSNVETGTTKVSLTSIVRIANALSVTVDDLLCDNLVKWFTICKVIDDCRNKITDEISYERDDNKQTDVSSAEDSLLYSLLGNVWESSDHSADKAASECP